MVILAKNEVYKIYQPRNKKFKFIKVKPHLQGIDQLEYKQPYLSYMFFFERCNVSKAIWIQFRSYCT